MPKSGADFETTRWTLIVAAGTRSPALEELASIYSAPVYSFFRRRGHHEHDAEDLTQAFLTDVFLGRGLVQRADPLKGRFRSFLIRALQRFDVDAARRRRVRERLRVDLDPERLGLLDVSDVADADRGFDVVWARTVCAEALARLDRELRSKGRSDYLTVFERRFLLPVTRGTTPPSIGQLAADLGVDPAERVSNIVHSVKRRFTSILRRVIARTVDDASDLDEELGYLIGLLERRRVSGEPDDG